MRAVLAVVVLAWLNVVLQPCVMAMPEPVGTTGSYELHVSLAEHHASNVEDQQEICLHCGASGSCSYAGFAECDQFEAARPNSPSKHTDGFDQPPATLNSAPVKRGSIRNRPTTIIKTGPEHLSPPVPFAIAYCVYLE